MDIIELGYEQDEDEKGEVAKETGDRIQSVSTRMVNMKCDGTCQLEVAGMIAA